jgi:hypothetical protein
MSGAARALPEDYSKPGVAYFWYWVSNSERAELGHGPRRRFVDLARAAVESLQEIVMTERPKTDKPSAERDALDKGHDSDSRGEHRYPDEHQTKSERGSRRDRDNLKRRLQRQN